MRIVVPLAGPDFIRADGRLKATVDLGGTPLLWRTLESRPWADRVAPADYIFVLRDHSLTRVFATEALGEWYPGAQTVFLGSETRGAALSASAGVALIADMSAPLVVDLADILYTCPGDPLVTFRDNPDCGGVALTFESDSPVYSYLATGPDGRVTQAAEKQVISRNASAGTYLFANASIYIAALGHALANEATQTHRRLYFVCPLFNGVLHQGLNVYLHPVTEVVDIKETGK